jgi:hypothetical protein
MSELRFPSPARGQRMDAGKHTRAIKSFARLRRLSSRPARQLLITLPLPELTEKERKLWFTSLPERNFCHRPDVK